MAVAERVGKQATVLLYIKYKQGYAKVPVSAYTIMIMAFGS